MSKLAEIFDVVPVDVTADSAPPVQASVCETPEDEDFELARAVQKELIEQGRAAVVTAMRCAAESEQARAVEVLATMLKTVSDMNSQLLGLSKQKQDIKQVKSGKNVPQLSTNVPQIGTANIIHVGSGNDINALLAAKIRESF